MSEDALWTRADVFVLRFRRNANALACRYGAPVYLVGGALVDEKPRDYDVRLVLPDEDIMRLYQGDPALQSAHRHSHNEYEPWEWMRGYDNLKQSRMLSARLRLPVDFQVQVLFEADRFKAAARRRLDTAPDWIFLAHRRDRP